MMGPAAEAQLHVFCASNVHVQGMPQCMQPHLTHSLAARRRLLHFEGYVSHCLFR